LCSSIFVFKLDLVSHPLNVFAKLDYKNCLCHIQLSNTSLEDKKSRIECRWLLSAFRPKIMSNFQNYENKFSVNMSKFSIWKSHRKSFQCCISSLQSIWSHMYLRENLRFLDWKTRSFDFQEFSLAITHKKRRSSWICNNLKNFEIKHQQLKRNQGEPFGATPSAQNALRHELFVFENG